MKVSERVRRETDVYYEIEKDRYREVEAEKVKVSERVRRETDGYYKGIRLTNRE